MEEIRLTWVFRRIDVGFSPTQQSALIFWTTLIYQQLTTAQSQDVSTLFVINASPWMMTLNALRVFWKTMAAIQQTIMISWSQLETLSLKRTMTSHKCSLTLTQERWMFLFMRSSRFSSRPRLMLRRCTGSLTLNCRKWRKTLYTRSKMNSVSSKSSWRDS